MRLDQFVPSFATHDAISNHAIQIQRLLRGRGFESEIYVSQVDPGLAAQSIPYEQYQAVSPQPAATMYHASTDSPMAAWLEAATGPGRRLCVDYHNITPAAYFARWETAPARSMHRARIELARLASCAEVALADSAYNQDELIALGYLRTSVSPLLVDLDEYHLEPDAATAERLSRARANGGRQWLFVGRVSPNKCQHDVIAAFAAYRRLFDPAARLTLVGGGTSPHYLERLRLMAARLEIAGQVEFRYGLSFTELLAYYRESDVFVCLSEHEGFCVPILESMELGLPVVAFRAAAVTDTVADAGVLLDDKDPLAVACAVADLMSDPAGCQSVVAAGHTRASEFSLARTSEKLLRSLDEWLDQ